MKLEQCFEVYPSIGNYNRLVRLCRQYEITFNGMDITDIESDDLNVLKETATFLVRTIERARKTTRKEKVNAKNIENSNKQYVIDRLGKNEFNDFVTWCNGNSIDIMSIIRTKGSKNELKSITSRYMFILKGIEKQNKQRERFRAKVWLSEHPGMAEYDTLSDWLEKHNIKINDIKSEERLLKILEKYRKEYEKPEKVEKKPKKRKITIDKNNLNDKRLTMMPESQLNGFSASHWLSEHPDKAEFSSMMKFLKTKRRKLVGIHSEEELTELLEEYYKVYEITVDKNGKTVAKKR